MTISVEFDPVGRRVEAQVHATILEAAREILVSESNSLSAPCGGKGLCGRCKVRILDGPVSPQTRAETRTLSPEELQAGYRLGCQAAILGPLRVEIPPESLSGRQDLQLEGEDVRVELQPAVARFAVEVTPSTLARPLSAWQQVLSHLESVHGVRGARVDLAVLRDRVPVVAGNQVLTVTVRGSEVINAFRSYPAPRPLGLAVDLGTTKIAGYLVDLESGVTVASDATMNPQIPYGEDVMSRLAYALADRDSRERLAALVRESVTKLVLGLLSRVPADANQIEEAVIVGNTAMQHLLLGLPVKQLAASPYIPAASFPMEVKARDLGLPMAPGAIVYFPPSIGGFVGADHVAMILGSRIHNTSSPTLGIDIGTNTEIVLATPTELVSCSCASGPAFEGAHIRHGMRAVDGAISEVKWMENGKRLSYRTIGGARPLGLCGSGVVDAIAGLASAGIMDGLGILDREHPEVRIDEEGKHFEYVLVQAAESGTGRSITINQTDVVAIQLAKAAIRAGTELLLASEGLTDEDLSTVVIAGAFGARLNLESALSIGLVPDVPVEKFRSVGNAAGTGARLALISLSERTMAERIAEVTRYMELTADPEFSGRFAGALRFPEQKA